MSARQYIFEIAAKTNKGMVRDGNEDNFVVTQDGRSAEWLIPTDHYINPLAGSILVVADGMGGMNAGEVASKIVVDSIKEDFANHEIDGLDGDGIKPFLFDIIKSAHNKIVAHGKAVPETEGMGSTVAIAWIKNNTAHICWVGDSRCYLFSNGILQQLSKDHSYVQTLVDKGEITLHEAFLHPESNIITQSMGDADRMPKPDYIAYNLTAGDTLLLCSDGLNSMLPDAAIENVLQQTASLPASVDKLISEANNAGGHDNITVLLVKLIQEELGMMDNIKDDIQKKSPEIKRGKFALIWVLIAIAILAIVTIERKKIFGTTAEKNKNPRADSSHTKTVKDSVIQHKKDLSGEKVQPIKTSD